MRIGILGSGEVGQALARGYLRHGHEVWIGTRKAQVSGLPVAPPAEVAASAELVVLAVLGSAAVELVQQLAPQLGGKVVDATNPLDFSTGAPAVRGPRRLPRRAGAAVELVQQLAPQLGGKVVVDATNPLDFSTGAPRLFVGLDDSLGEQVQRAAPTSRVVKAYNTVGNTLMVDPELPGGPPTMLIGGNEQAAKDQVSGLLAATGWDVVDLGGIEASRYLEPLCLAWVAYGVRTGTWQHAFRLLRAQPDAAQQPGR